MEETSTHNSQFSGQTVTTMMGPQWRARLDDWFKGEFHGETRVGFWHPELRPVRARVGKEWVQTSRFYHRTAKGAIIEMGTDY